MNENKYSKFLGCSAHQNWVHLSWYCKDTKEIQDRLNKLKYKYQKLYGTHTISELHEWVGNIPIKKYYMLTYTFHSNNLNYLFKF